MESVTFSQDETVFTEGESASAAYLIELGTVNLLHEDVQHPCPAGSIIGVSALLASGAATHPYSAIAAGEVRLLPLPQSGWKQWLETCPESAQQVIHALVQSAAHFDKTLITPTAPLPSSEGQTAKPLSSLASQGTQTSAAALGSLAEEFTEIKLTSLQEPEAFPALSVPLLQLPLQIGGYAVETGMDKRQRQNHINIASEKTPPIVSPQHCQIEVYEENLILRDLGSRFTTILNGQPIGRGKGIYSAKLQKGTNTLQLGGVDSPVHLKIECL